MKYKFKIPIGDWSDDGHGKYEDYFIESNKPLEEVRELYIQACDKIGFSLDGSYKQTKLTPNAEYEDYKFSNETLDALLEFGVVIDDDDKYKDLVEYIREEESVDEAENFVHIVLQFIKTQDPALELSIIPDDVPMFQFYGYDTKNRHIGYFGYGLFS